jgi:hypothetical protein
MTNTRRTIEKPAETPKEVYDYWHERWAAYLNQHKDAFVRAGIINMSFTEKCPDCPNGLGEFTYEFSSDGTVQFVDHEGDAVIEYDSYEIGYRIAGDLSYDPVVPMKEDKLRYPKNVEQFIKLLPVIPLLHEAFYAAIREAEEKFNIEMPKYL